MAIHRERMLKALRFDKPDKIPVLYHPSTAGLHVHGQKMLDLFNAHPHDGSDKFDHLPAPPPHAFDPDGRYHEFKVNEWGATWEFRIFGVAGMLHSRKYATYRDLIKAGFPPHGPDDGMPWVAEAKKTHLTMGSRNSLLELAMQMFPLEMILADLALEDPDLLELLDRFVEYMAPINQRHIKAGVDMICFGDDYGEQRATLMSPAMFDKIFKPRLEALAAPIRAAGKMIWFHSCGELRPILDSILDIGVTILWPQLTLYGNDNGFLDYLAERRVSLLIHPCRQHLIPWGTPAQIDEFVARMAERYHRAGGGGVFWVEIENDAPWENVVALIKAIDKYR